MRHNDTAYHDSGFLQIHPGDTTVYNRFVEIEDNSIV